jgi:hypothetical protein
MDSNNNHMDGNTAKASAGAGNMQLARLTLEVALTELGNGAGEVGSNNRGPHVAKYMGAEGLPWCVGFATWCYKQACTQLGLARLLTERWSSSRLASQARALGLLIEPGDVCSGGNLNEQRRGEAPSSPVVDQLKTGRDRARTLRYETDDDETDDANTGRCHGHTQPLPGHFFILRGGPTGYRHTGIIRELCYGADGRLVSIATIEGNVSAAAGDLAAPGSIAPRPGGLDVVTSRVRSVSGMVLAAF